MRLATLISRAVKPRLNPRFGDLLTKEVDAAGDFSEASHADEVEDLTLSGISLVLEYEDSRGQRTQRVVTCKQYEIRAGKEYVRAFCHHRGAVRSFRLDRIADIFDPETGESLSPVQEFFARFSPDKITNSGLSWNLSVGRRADLVALLNALVFLARCDRDFHPAERTCLEGALTSFWMRFELPDEPDFEDILKYCDRLSPDGETFWIAMHRFREEARLSAIFRRQARLLIEADGIVKQEEAYWSVEIDDFLSGD